MRVFSPILGGPRRIAGEPIDHFGVAPVSVCSPNYLDYRVAELERVDSSTLRPKLLTHDHNFTDARSSGASTRAGSRSPPPMTRCEIFAPGPGKHSDVHVAHRDLPRPIRASMPGIARWVMYIAMLDARAITTPIVTRTNESTMRSVHPTQCRRGARWEMRVSS